MDFSFSVTKDKASDWAKYVQEMSDYDFLGLQQKWIVFSDEPPQSDYLGVINLPLEYLELRKQIVAVFKRSREGVKGRQADYHSDVEVGLALYEFLSKHGFSVVLAETDDWWRFLSVRLFPDLTYSRYPADATERINTKRFFSHTRRIWLKTLWWYVHLSWQGSVESTREVLVKLGTDAISQLIERSKAGYRTDISRALMKRYSCESSWCDSKKFQRTMALHLIKVDSVEPSLVDGGVSGYAQQVFDEVKGAR